MGHFSFKNNSNISFIYSEIDNNLFIFEAYCRVHNSPLLGLFMKYNAYVPVGGNERGRGATPTSISIFDSNDMKIL